MTGRPARAATGGSSRRRGPRVMIRSMSEPGPDKYVETPRDRWVANAVLLFFLLLVVGGGIWLANAMFEQRALDDCMAQGRRNCAPPIDTPAR